MDCAAPCHDGEPVPAEPDARLCRTCRTRLAYHLRRLPGIYDELDLTPATRGRGRGHGDGLPYSDTVSECRRSIRSRLFSWAALAVEDRRANITLTTAPECAGFLHASLRWIVFREWAGDFADEMRSDHGRAKALLDPFTIKRFPLLGGIAMCAECQRGTIIITIYASQGDRRTSHATCEICGANWTFGPDWLRLLPRQVIRTDVLVA